VESGCVYRTLNIYRLMYFPEGTKRFKRGRGVSVQVFPILFKDFLKLQLKHQLHFEITRVNIFEKNDIMWCWCWCLMRFVYLFLNVKVTVKQLKVHVNLFNYPYYTFFVLLVCIFVVPSLTNGMKVCRGAICTSLD